MAGDRFDELTKDLAGAKNRRGFLKGLVSAGLAAVGAGTVLSGVARAACPPLTAPCGTSACCSIETQQCCPGGVCCGITQTCCGTQCCGLGSRCVAGKNCVPSKL